MSRVLIWKRVFPGSQYDIFNSMDYTSLYHHVVDNWNKTTQNWGNRLWFQGIMSVLDTGENKYGYLEQEIDAEHINSSYDFIVLPMANIFNIDYRHLMLDLTEKLEQIRIPIYVVVCGIQVDSYREIPELVNSLGKDASRFIRAVYNTGGEFALRGYYTKEFFDRLGFPSAVVTGCPSLYQMGPEFSVTTKKENLEILKPVFNGHVKHYRKLYGDYPASVFLDQDAYFYPMFDPDYLNDTGLRSQMNFEKVYGLEAAKLLSQGRIVTAADMNDWYNYLKQGGFNYSFGSRIHGTIMALLSGVPSTIITLDARTQEMAEFFDIPSFKPETAVNFNKKDLLTLYESMNYTKFNAGFRDKFKAYEQFLTQHRIVSHANTENRFFYEKEPIVFAGTQEKQKQFAEFSKKCSIISCLFR